MTQSIDVPTSVDTFLQELAAIQQVGPKRVAILGSRHVPITHQYLIWRYLQEWYWVKPLLNGHDLRRLGYKPGRPFQAILEQLRCLTLNGELTTPAEAEAWLQEHFPLPQAQYRGRK